MDRMVTVSGQDGAFPVAPGTSVLEAALRANRWLPHACSQGTCGTCKIRVLSGEVDHGAADETILSADERSSGLALACQSKPHGDLAIAPVNDADPGRPMHPLRDYTGTVRELSDIARQTRRLVVELDEPMEFDAGQYAELIVPGSGVARQYSMANPPSEQRLLEFHVRNTAGGLATEGWIFDSLAVGDRIDLRGPLGQFGVVEAREEPAILIGGGTGLAPLKSIVRHALDHDLLPAIHLYHGGRREADLYDVECFRAMEATDSRFHYHPVLSEENWDGATGMVTDAVLGDFASCRGHSAYLCGPPAMVVASVKALKRRRMSPRLIFKEEFTVNAPRPAAEAV
ncbi:NADH:ubiquinone reductase (Na(+)-transporting) subunit F [Rhodococcus opacus]|uniref:NADH:ubiquinone reductase (Na(+)-transporting) subunit F n=1 Tax=Rhodococcus opacus TaxID=37919 RepID=UPI002948E8DB|nr:2Fe-2S iron-sulfur cluster-binding protein [Rhodococcus opacus]MDV6244986.1 2Fe-2S iron-sulfur cluster-binding protein [Rhodococcus opacus]